jgi:hypothetical protein
MADHDARGRLRFAVFDAAGGDPVRRMYGRDAAIEFAKSLPVPEGLEPVWVERPRSISPRAVALRRELGLTA